MARIISRTRIGKKGIYDLVTTFLFIMVVLFVVLAVIYMGAILNKSKKKMNDDIFKIQYIRDAKNRILSNDCLGTNPEQDRMHIRCNMSKGFIKGYSIRMLPYPNCTNETIEYDFRFSSDEPLEEQIYFIGIVSNETGDVCPGQLEVDI